jgi:hypothetical protein
MPGGPTLDQEVPPLPGVPWRADSTVLGHYLQPLSPPASHLQLTQGEDPGSPWDRASSPSSCGSQMCESQNPLWIWWRPKECARMASMCDSGALVLTVSPSPTRLSPQVKSPAPHSQLPIQFHGYIKCHVPKWPLDADRDPGSSSLPGLGPPFHRSSSVLVQWVKLGLRTNQRPRAISSHLTHTFEWMKAENTFFPHLRSSSLDFSLPLHITQAEWISPQIPSGKLGAVV